MKNLFKIIFICLLAVSSSALSLDEVKCLSVEDVKILPFRGEKVDDDTYNYFVSAGYKALSCLISQVSNTKKMSDPRKAPPYEGIRVGDVAFFIISDILQKPINELINDRSFKEEFSKNGVYAYFDYVNKGKNRVLLQSSLSKHHL
ncbi:hypothetical protein [Microbulbifer sp. TYP-18]|uniref:hypothetical protein n=1 Tax=Microbulbifer sp. TYP-18 TaxID=3230024 RepID=UPI0034C65D0F